MTTGSPWGHIFTGKLINRQDFIRNLMNALVFVSLIKSDNRSVLVISDEYHLALSSYSRLLLNRSPINYHVTLVFRASRALRRPKLNPNPSL